MSGLRLLVEGASGVPTERVSYRGEQSEWQADMLTAAAGIPLSDEEIGPRWLIVSVPNGTVERVAKYYRRVEIHAIDTPAALASSGEVLEPDRTAHLPVLRRALVPGSGGASLAAPEEIGSDVAYRVKLRVRWDSPSRARAHRRLPWSNG